MNSVLLEPIKIGSFNLKNRVIFAPLTRCRAGSDRIPNKLMAEYYGQRSSAGLIISEATAVSPMAVGYPNTPGIWSEEQVKGWKLVTDEVHRKGGIILLQLWHVGRISDPVYLSGNLPVAPSAIAPKGYVNLLRPKKKFVTPRALDLDEIPSVIESYYKGALNAKRAGFDGVEIHGANGYLPDQFLQDSTNKRTDRYGGSIENRARFVLEVVDRVVSVWGADRVGMHLAPRGDSNDAGDSNPRETFTYIAEELGKRNLAFICSREYQANDSIAQHIKAAFKGSYIANEKFSKESGEKIIQEKGADAVAFGRLFISNPDLPERFRTNSSLIEPDFSTFYTFEAKGYTDYPFCKPSSL